MTNMADFNISNSENAVREMCPHSGAGQHTV